MKIKISELAEKLRVMYTIDINPHDHLTYAVKKNITNITAILKPKNEALQDKITDVNISFAHTGERGVLLTDEKGNYQYTPDQQKKRNARLRELYTEYENQEVDFTPYFCQPCARMLELDLFTVEELKGFLFEPDKQEA